jgi:F-type H+-transporting ATPase subunit a
LSSDAPAAAGAPDSVPQQAAPPAATASKPPAWQRWLVVIVFVVVLDFIAFFVFPPFPAGEPGQPIGGIGDLISANLELPAPHVIWDLAPDQPVPAGQIVFFHPSITASIFTTWLIIIVVVALAFICTRGMKLIPTRLQNGFEFIYESLENFAVSLGGPDSRPYVPIFAGFFLFILFCNWSGLLPFFGKVEIFRAPTSDVNVTIGLALVAFLYFEAQGFRKLGVRGYLGKFFSLKGFKHGIGQGFIDIYVGVIEFFLEFVKPVTLAMRLWGNIFGGELALGVITALTIALLPIAMVSLELLLNFVQALIFSVLTLMYTVIAVENHDVEEHAAPEFATEPEGGVGPPLSVMEIPAAH